MLKLIVYIFLAPVITGLLVLALAIRQGRWHSRAR